MEPELDQQWDSRRMPEWLAETKPLKHVDWGEGIVPWYNRETNNISLLYTCRLIHTEALPIYYQVNTFKFYSAYDLGCFQYRIGSHGHLDMIQRIELGIDLFDQITDPSDSWDRFFSVISPMRASLKFTAAKAKGIRKPGYLGIKTFFPRLRHVGVDFVEGSFRCNGLRHDLNADTSATDALDRMLYLLSWEINVQSSEVTGLIGAIHTRHAERCLLETDGPLELENWDEAFCQSDAAWGDKLRGISPSISAS